jgi:hypothetical protein
MLQHIPPYRLVVDAVIVKMNLPVDQLAQLATGCAQTLRLVNRAALLPSWL